MGKQRLLGHLSGEECLQRRRFECSFYLGRATVKPLSTLGYYRLTLLSKPVADRAVYQLIKKNKFQSFLEIGMGTGDRCQQILRVAAKFSNKPIRYTGIDLFDARPKGSFKLINMHKKLKGFDAKTQLVPGPVGPSIERIANSHLRTDLIVISPGTQKSELDSVMSFFPRMLHANSLVLVQSQEKIKQLTRLDIERWAKQAKDSKSAKLQGLASRVA